MEIDKLMTLKEELIEEKRLLDGDIWQLRCEISGMDEILSDPHNGLIPDEYDDLYEECFNEKRRLNDMRGRSQELLKEIYQIPGPNYGLYDGYKIAS